MESRSAVLLHDEPMLRAASKFGRRLRRLPEVPFTVVFLKSHSLLDAAKACARREQHAMRLAVAGKVSFSKSHICQLRQLGHQQENPHPSSA